MEKIRVLIADDSVVYRSQIRAALQSVEGVEVIGAASNGRLALDRFAIGPVDLLILDLEMPEMDGLATLAHMREKNISCKTLVFSSTSKRGSELTLEALQYGASDFITKPDNSTSDYSPAERIKALLEPKIIALFPKPEPQMAPLGKIPTYPTCDWDLVNPKAVVIGSSTGGPTALEKIFANLNGRELNIPIFITQHMPPLFTATLAERLAQLTGMPAREARDGEVAQNQIYVAPGNFHMRISGGAQKILIHLNQDEPLHSVRPAVDHLFESAAQTLKSQCLGFVLTGMGYDGNIGAQKIKAQGGSVVIQDEKSCVVFGMPGAVYRSGAYDRCVNLQSISEILIEKAVRR